MTGLLLTNARVVGLESVVESGWVATSDGVIAGFGGGAPEPMLARGREIIDVDGATVLPGFIDVHVHGAVGHEVMDGDVDGLSAMSVFFASHGVTSFLATTWTAPADETMSALRAVAEAMSAGMPGAEILGAHMEGPYLSQTKCGAQDPRSVRPPDLDEARCFLDTGAVKLITIAPELARAQDLIAVCLDRGARVSVGHTEASFEQVADAVAWGARHVTHTFNAMPSLHHRRPGPVGAAMVLPELLAELIADNYHVHPAVLRAFMQAKGTDGVVLVTDALRPTGLDGGGSGGNEFTIGGRAATVEHGVARLLGGTIAGSVLTMDVALRNLIRATGKSLVELWPTASRNGASAAGVADRKGVIAPKMDADLVVVGDDIDVRMTVVAGQVVYTAPVALPAR
ncbi:MAG TPA: N-acetylglucosamine-6-phosphate deacetylase [Mycobacterium sp.]